MLANSDGTDRGQEAAWSITSWSFCYSRDVSVLAAHVMASHERTVRTYEGPQRRADKGLSSLTFHFLFSRELSRFSRLARPNIVSIFHILTSGVFYSRAVDQILVVHFKYVFVRIGSFLLAFVLRNLP